MISSLGLLTLALLSSCSYGSRQSYGKIPSTTFLTQPLIYVGEPFDGEWRAPDHKALQGDLYIKIAPVIVAPPLANDNPKLLDAAQHLSKRFEAKLKEEFARLTPYNIFLVEHAPAGKTLLTIECALIDLNVTNAAANIAGDVAGTWIPGASFVSGLFDKGHITFAAKVYADKKLVAEFAECDTTPISIVGSLNNYNSWGHQRSIIDQWSHSIAMDVKGFAEGKRVNGAKRIQLFSGYTSEIAAEKQ
ncbi:MAG: hypothetical protein R3Y56_03395 [Akkermansia sp.]